MFELCKVYTIVYWKDDVRNTFFTLIIIAVLLAGCSTQQAPSTSPAPVIVTQIATPTTVPKVFRAEDVELNFVDSSCFSRVGYDKEFEVLVVEFKETGAIYAYFDFSNNDYEEFITAGSLGGYFNNSIKGFYGYEKVN